MTVVDASLSVFDVVRFVLTLVLIWLVLKLVRQGQLDRLARQADLHELKKTAIDLARRTDSLINDNTIVTRHAADASQVAADVANNVNQKILDVNTKIEQIFQDVLLDRRHQETQADAQRAQADQPPTSDASQRRRRGDE